MFHLKLIISIFIFVREDSTIKSNIIYDLWMAKSALDSYQLSYHLRCDLSYNDQSFSYFVLP